MRTIREHVFSVFSVFSGSNSVCVSSLRRTRVALDHGQSLDYEVSAEQRRGRGMDDSDLMARVDREFIGMVSPTSPRIQAGGHPCQGIYTTPKGQRPKTAFIATH